MTEKNKPATKSVNPTASKNTFYCSFCGKSQHEVRKMIAGPTVFICDECVELCMDIIREETKPSLLADGNNIDQVRRETCAILPFHGLLIEKFFRMAQSLKSARNDDRQSGYRVLLTGVKGSGLPSAIIEIWKTFDLPIVHYDAARLRGERIINGADMFQRLLEQSEYNLERASRGAILIDNLDRIFDRSPENRIVQEELELMMAGTLESIPPRGSARSGDLLQLNTVGITFIATTSKLHANDPPILEAGQEPKLHFERDRTKATAALVEAGCLKALVERFDEIVEYLPYTEEQIGNWLGSPSASKYLTAFNTGDGVLPNEIRETLVRMARERGAGFEGLVSILRLVSLRSSFSGPDEQQPPLIDSAWLARNI